MVETRIYGKTDTGIRRLDNEDAFVIVSELDLCALADGMGGAAAGELASRYFTESVAETFAGVRERSEQEIVGLVEKAFRSANERILLDATNNPAHKGMGCTAELLAFLDHGYVLGHVGDSRTYLFRSGQIKRLTNDHSVVQSQIDQGLITAVEARKHPLRNVILRAVGTNEVLAIDLIRGRIQNGDLFLLCSDGLTDMVDEVVLKRVLSADLSLHEKVDQLIEVANSAGGHDNITVVLGEVAGRPAASGAGG
ncbi:MAG TPA: Stp1/IreP family PP2C-type Ser/Thr phosphatase [Syntrophobacteraceae bacterium]|nr:Stp1/IreP family PP2C-type Ser/Thr phosphatase [Syntrophobacteraceae bacterium]HBZ56683.1 Stp1/IreP family PP2C-type Ser/Thr phosphatase [Syntrophobacteraceae bacterium]